MNHAWSLNCSGVLSSVSSSPDGPLSPTTCAVPVLPHTTTSSRCALCAVPPAPLTTSAIASFTSCNASGLILNLFSMIGGYDLVMLPSSPSTYFTNCGL